MRCLVLCLQACKAAGQTEAGAPGAGTTAQELLALAEKLCERTAGKRAASADAEEERPTLQRKAAPVDMSVVLRRVAMARAEIADRDRLAMVGHMAMPALPCHVAILSTCAVSEQPCCAGEGWCWRLDLIDLRLSQSFHLLRCLRFVLMLCRWLMTRTTMSMKGLVSLCQWGTLRQTTRRRCWQAWAARPSSPPRACPLQMLVRHLLRALQPGRARQGQVGQSYLHTSVQTTWGG